MIEPAKKLGLIGRKLEHSFSKKYFASKFEKQSIVGWSYDLYPLEQIDHVLHLIGRESGLIGFNVTIPYKEAIIPFLDGLDNEARQIGAVNTVKIDSGQLYGYNTDVYGFERSLLNWQEASSRPSALVLGTGGASKAILYVLRKLGIASKIVSRQAQRGDLTYDEIDKSIIQSHQLIINTTPLGTYPNVGSTPRMPYQYITEEHFLYDLVYNPLETGFMKKGMAQGAQVKNGYEMLTLQAEKAWEIWNN